MKLYRTYTPVNCSFYDLLEADATLGKTSEIVFISQDTRKLANGKIVDIYIRNKAEFLKLENGNEIPLDKIIKFNGQAVPDIC